MPRCCWGFLAGIEGTPLQKITKRPIWRTTKHDPSSVKRKRVAKDFRAEEVIRLMENEEFCAWCDKNLSDDSLDENEDERDRVAESRWKCCCQNFIFAAYSQLPTVLNNLELSYMERVVTSLSE